MKIALSLFVVLLIAGSVGVHTYSLLRARRVKMALAQVIISILSITGAIAAIYRPPIASIARIMMYISPW